MDKKEIIAEIKHVASLLGGKSPSIADMEKHSGLLAYQWKGKYWIKWSEALTEAGYKPNRFSSPALGKENIIKSILLYIKSINRMPLFLELKMHKIEDPSFPNITTIKNNFNNKEYLDIKKELKSFCIQNSAYSNLLPLFNNLDDNNTNKSEEISDDKSNLGYVYIIQHGNRKEYKIGKTINTIRREGEISIELPEQIKPIHYIKTDDPSGVENYWHNRFKDKRKNGEWFQLSNNDVKSFKKWKKIY